MPIYQYVCTDCGEPLEVRQSFTDEALTVCPSCEGRLRKVLNAVGVLFKGSGFYRNDSRAAAKPSSTAETPAAKSDTRSESKPETKPETKPKSESKPGTEGTSSSSSSSSASVAAAS